MGMLNLQQGLLRVAVNELMEASAFQPMLQLIDPAWTLLPPLMAAVYSTHPRAVLTAKAAVAYCLLAVWSVRLTHSYFRRQVLRPRFDSLQPSKVFKCHSACRDAFLEVHIATTKASTSPPLSTPSPSKPMFPAGSTGSLGPERTGALLTCVPGWASTDSPGCPSS